MLDINSLERSLSKVPWSAIGAQLGFCTHVPAALLGLTSANQAKREESYWQIDNYVVVQGSLFEGGFYVVPFLVEMIRSGLEEKTEVYDLLFEIANGSQVTSTKVKYSIVKDSFSYYLPDENGDFAQFLQVACRGAVLKGFLDYVTDMECGKLQTKEKALELITSFDEHPRLLKTVLQAALAKEMNPSFRSRLAQSIEESRNSKK
jgi:hypothetical protein